MTVGGCSPTMYPEVSDVYRVPKVIARVRELRASSLNVNEVLDQLPPSKLYAMCEEEADNPGVVKALYNHAFLEAGFVASEPGGDSPYAICPVCGFDFTVE